MLLKLRSRARLDAVVSGVMRTRSHLVNDECAVLIEEELNGEQADKLECVGKGLCNFSRIFFYGLWHACRQDRSVQDVVAVDVFRYGEGVDGTIRSSSADYGELAFVVDPFFNHYAPKRVPLIDSIEHPKSRPASALASGFSWPLPS